VVASLEMTAVAWSAIGLLAAALFGSLYYLGSRIDGLGSRLDSRIDHLETRIDALASRIDVHLERHAG